MDANGFMISIAGLTSDAQENLTKVARQPNKSNKSKTTHSRTKSPTSASTRAEP